MTPQKNGAGRGGPTPRSETSNCSEGFYHVPSIGEAATALVLIDDAGVLAELRDELICMQREWHKRCSKRTVGENIYIDQVAKYLQADGIDQAEAWNAVRDAVRPSWSAALLQTIVEFAGRMESAEVAHE